jgi:hypothetical protein
MAVTAGMQPFSGGEPWQQSKLVHIDAARRRPTLSISVMGSPTNCPSQRQPLA